VNDRIIQLIAVIIVVALAVLSRLVRALLVHQQKMTQLLQEGRSSAQNDDRILRELAELRNLVAHQALAIDKMKEENRVLTQGEPEKSRLNV
jgi:hypothetical protein